MYRVSIEWYIYEWKFWRTRNAVGTRTAGECFHSFSISFRKHRDEKKKNNLQIPFAREIITWKARASSVFLCYGNRIFNQSARVFS